MVETIAADSTEQDSFQPGDSVILAEGPYQGSPGVLLGLKEDANWAEVREHDHKVRCHPVAWLRRRP